MKFIPNRSFERDYLQSDEAIPMLRELAAEAASAAKGFAPVRLSHYRDSIESEAGHNEFGEAVGRVRATDFKAVWIETGTGPPMPTPVYAPLRKGAESVAGSLGKG